MLFRLQGLKTSVSNKAFLTFETLLVWLNEKIPTTAGVKYIFTLPEGNEIRDVSQFVGGRSYVVSSVRKIIHVPYGEAKERFWRNRFDFNIVVVVVFQIYGDGPITSNSLHARTTVLYEKSVKRE